MANLSVVSAYEYLGMWIDSDLSWRTHLNELVAKGQGANRSVDRLLSLRAVPTPLKRMMWKAVVRSKLDHGSAIYRTNTKQAKALESIQHQAGARMLAVNRRTPIPIVRAMVGLKSSLASRRAGRRMKYFHTLSNMGKERWPKHLFSLPKVKKSKLKGPQPGFWPEVVGKEVDETDVKVDCSRKAYEGNDFLTSTSEGVLGPCEIPKKDWWAAVAGWVEWKGVEESTRGGGTASSSRLFLRLIEGCTDGLVLSAAPSLATTADVLRVRLICGTNALHASIGRHAKYAEGSSSLDRLRTQGKCPCCKSGPEDVEHFVLDCDPVALRELKVSVGKSCECKGVETCLTRFDKLDSTGKLLFMLGQSLAVTGREVESSVDRVLRKHLVGLWLRRSKALDAIVQADEEDESSDFDSDSEAEESEKGGAQSDIRSFFSASSAGLGANGHLSTL